MTESFPSAAPELRVGNLVNAARYYEKALGFHWDWGTEGIGQVSRGGCRIFLTDDSFRQDKGVGTPVVIWINLNSRKEVDEMHQAWKGGGARVLSPPESKPWNLHEFIAADLDGHLLRVVYDFAWELPDRGGRRDDSAERKEALGQGPSEPPAD